MSSKKKMFKEVDPTAMNAGGEDVERTRRAAAPSAISFAPIVHTTAPAVSKVAPPLPSHQRKYVWALDSVPELPDCHVLERSAVFVPHSQPSVIAERISNVLREQSIEAEYDNDKAKVKCITEDGVDFRVRLYRGRGKFNHGIIVEVQRRFGVSLDFRNITMAILDSAEGKEADNAAVPPPPPALGSSSSANTLPLVSDSEDDGYQADGASSLRMISKMLEHKEYDGTHLALQTLSSLTDATKVGMSTAKSVSEALLVDAVVGGKVLSLILDKQGEEDELFKLRTAAMTVLANVLKSVQGRIETPLRDQLHPVLIQDLRSADKNPRVAVQAARCVEMLLTTPGDMSQSAADLHSALTAALEAGAARHAGLERQAKLCLDKFS